ncbi:hypothetical protein ACX17C_28575 [Bacillus cereus]
MNKKALLGSILSLTLVVGIALPSGASAEIKDDWSAASYDPSTKTNKDNKTISVTAGYGHVKLWWKNNGSGPVAITVKHNASGKEYVTAKLEKGDTLTFRSNDLYPQGMKAGAYTISYAGGSYNLNVDFSGFSANSINDISN